METQLLKNSTITSSQKDYVRNFVASVLGSPAFTLNSDQEYLIFRELSRKVEIEERFVDLLGNWDWRKSTAHHSGQLYRPWIDMALAELRQKLRLNPSLMLEPNWPDNKPFALCLTHDVDIVTRYPKMLELFRPLAQSISAQSNYNLIGREGLVLLYRALIRLTQNGNDELWHYEDWLKLEDSFGFKSTFFYFPSMVSKRHHYDCTYRFNDEIRFNKRKMMVKEMMQEMSIAGWEIGLHGSIHSALGASLLIDQRNEIEGLLGQEILSTRQHYLRYCAEVTPSLQHAAGFKIDSSHGINEAIGFRAGTSFPYWAWDHQSERALPILEVPQHVMDISLFGKQSLNYSEEVALRHCIKLMDEIESVGGCLTLSWHPNYINIPKFFNVYKNLLEEGKRRNAWGCTVQDLHHWWVARSLRINKIPEPSKY